MSAVQAVHGVRDAAADTARQPQPGQGLPRAGADGFAATGPLGQRAKGGLAARAISAYSALNEEAERRRLRELLGFDAYA